MKKLKYADTDKLAPIIMTTALILIVSAFFIPVVAIMLLQELLFFSTGHLSFIHPPEAFISFGAAMLWLAVVILSILFTKMYADRKDRPYRLAGLHILLLIAAAPVFVLSVYHYTYLDSQGVQGNAFWTLAEESVAWEEVEYVSRQVEEGSQRVLSYTFSDGKTEVTVPYDSRDYETRRAINVVLNKYQWEITDIETGSDTESVTFFSD